tara:strand:+ start:353 stop:460 length:108 start_codon:yes stop_codon:yes gene_type:complete
LVALGQQAVRAAMDLGQAVEALTLEGAGAQHRVAA